MNYIQSFDGEKIAYQFLKPYQTNQPTLVVVHGLGGDPRLLEEFVAELQALQPNHNILLYYARGHGLSSKKFPQPKFNSTLRSGTIVTVLAKDLRTLLTELEIKRPILIGHSYGGIVVQTYLNQKYEPQPQQTIFICSTLAVPGSKLISALSYWLLSLLPSKKIALPKLSPQQLEQFRQSADISLSRHWYDIKIVSGLLQWWLQFLSLSSWRNPNPSVIDQKTCYYIYGQKDIIVTKQTQERQISKLTKIHKICLNTGHIAPITDSNLLAQTISTIL